MPSLTKQGYRLVGSHSAVKVCQWTKESLRSGRVCYKEAWYGVKSHRCLQCTVDLRCLNRCLYCWRSFEALEDSKKVSPSVDEPSELIDGLIEGQRSLLVGFKGNPKVDRRRWDEAQSPTNAALSLVGESLLYPEISELLREFKRRGFSTILVSKGTSPERLAGLEVEPTMIYLSLCAPDRATYQALERPLVPKGWERMMESLKLMESFSSTKVTRITLVKGWNMKEPSKYGKLIAISGCDYVEPKAFMWVGEARSRLPREGMPTMEDVRTFAQEMATTTGYSFKAEWPPSRVALLSKG